MSIKSLKLTAGTFCALLASVTVPLGLNAASPSSGDYAVTADTVDGGGGSSASAAYKFQTSIGGFGGVGHSPMLTVKHGYIGQVYEIAGVTVAPGDTNIAEGSRCQFAAEATLDDGTVLHLSSAELLWMALDAPVISINSAGQPMANCVYRDRNASLCAEYRGQSNIVTLRILNMNDDDFGTYARDRIADDWQVRYFGENNPKAAAQADPDGDGQSNLFEYMAGLDPSDGGSRFRLSLAAVPGHPLQKQITFSPCLRDRGYTLQYRSNLNQGDFKPLPATVETDVDGPRIITDLNATDPVRFYRVIISRH